MTFHYRTTRTLPQNFPTDWIDGRASIADDLRPVT